MSAGAEEREWTNKWEINMREGGGERPTEECGNEILRKIN